MFLIMVKVYIKVTKLLKYNLSYNTRDPWPKRPVTKIKIIEL